MHSFKFYDQSFLPASVSLPSQHLDASSPEKNHVLEDGYFHILADPTLQL